MLSRSRPSSAAVAAAASAFGIWWAPCSPIRTGTGPAGVISVKDGRPRSSSWTSAAAKSGRPAEAPSARPNVTIRASVRLAMARTRWSSALRMATPPAAAAGRAAGSSPLARATCSMPPNSPVWAWPTLSTAPTRGGAISHRNAMCPGPRAAISSTMNRVCSSARSTVSGNPNSLFQEPSGEMVGPSRSTSWAVRSLVEVLPAEPVRPATVTAGSRAITSWASLARAVGTSSTSSPGTPAGRVPSIAVAPASRAAAAKSCPSTCSPSTAANSPPAPARRESMTTGPVTTTAGSAPPSSRASVFRAISPSESGITGLPSRPRSAPGAAAPRR
jgi:hypothetical protein